MVYKRWLRVTDRPTNYSVYAAVQSIADKLHERVAQIDDGAAGLWFDVLPLGGVRVDYLESTELVEEHRNGAKVYTVINE